VIFFKSIRGFLRSRNYSPCRSRVLDKKRVLYVGFLSNVRWKYYLMIGNSNNLYELFGVLEGDHIWFDKYNLWKYYFKVKSYGSWSHGESLGGESLFCFICFVFFFVIFLDPLDEVLSTSGKSQMLNSNMKSLFNISKNILNVNST
jgi:hypothetical protein